MLTKILFTAAVIGLVVAVYRLRRTRGTPPHQRPSAGNPAGVRMVYGLVGVLVALGAVLYFVHWRDEHRVVEIRVFDDQSSAPTVYRAYRKTIQGRTFESLDGRQVTLGERDRVEMVDVER